jgi:hypothetical protein
LLNKPGEGLSGMYTFPQMVQMAWGKVRRFLWPIVAPKSFQASMAKREGSCSRCGACCQLLYKCPYLEEKNGVFACSIQGKKPGNCIRFPIDARDLADRDIVMPDVKCGYSFPDTPSAVPLSKG